MAYFSVPCIDCTVRTGLHTSYMHAVLYWAWFPSLTFADCFRFCDISVKLLWTSSIHIWDTNMGADCVINLFAHLAIYPVGFPCPTGEPGTRGIKKKKNRGSLTFSSAPSCIASGATSFKCVISIPNCVPQSPTWFSRTCSDEHRRYRKHMFYLLFGLNEKKTKKKQAMLFKFSILISIK